MIVRAVRSLSIVLLIVCMAAFAVTEQAQARRQPRKGRCRGGARGHHASHAGHRLRGNPSVTRAVAKQALLEKLPELAALAGIDPATDSDILSANLPPQPMDDPALPDDSVTFAAVASQFRLSHTPDPSAKAGVAATGGGSGYMDSEIEENEAPDVATEVESASDELEDLPGQSGDIASFRTEFARYMARLNPETAGTVVVTDNGIDKQTLMEALMNWLGTRYRFGGGGRNGIDCSAFTGTMYRSQGFQLPRTAAAQWDFGTKVDPADMQFGDLVFFHTRRAVYVSHVGMYLGNGMFAHASSRNGVTVSSLGATYYAGHFIGARRFDLTAVRNAAVAQAQAQQPSSAEQGSN